MFGLMVSNGCISCETIAGTSITRTSAFKPEIKVLHLFTCRRIANAPNHSQTSF
jgi:hypothetical protein